MRLAASANLYLTRKRKKTIELEQNNQEVIIESIPTNETLIAKDKIDDMATIWLVWLLGVVTMWLLGQK